MITSADFDAAIKTNFRDQMVNIVKENNSSKDKTINIKKQISSVLLRPYVSIIK
jgi:hypothetical protein